MRIAQKKQTFQGDLIRQQSKGKKINQKLTYTMLNLICSYIISENKYIRKKGYNNIKELLDVLNLEIYINDKESQDKLDFIKSGIQARIGYNLTDKNQVLDYIHTSNPHIYPINISLQELNNDEVNYVNNFISNLLDSSLFNDQIHEYDAFVKDYDSASPSQKMEIIEDWKNLIVESHNMIRQNKIDSTDDEIFSLKDGAFEDYTRYCYTEYSNPSNKLATGMQGFNYLLDGGFESKRVYCFFGLQGEGKSTTLLNMAVQIKKFNRNYKPKDPTKTPCVVLLTMENHTQETFGRLFSLVTEKEKMTDYNVNECIDMMKNEGGMKVTNDNPIDIIVKYKPLNSIDTSYLYELYDDLSDQGYEVIAYVIDYLKRIRSVFKFNASDERLKYGAITNELKAIATELDIPIITASQFNRDANSKIDDARSNDKSSLVNLLGRSNIGESMLILDNLDAGFMIVPEQIGTSEKYLGIKLAKSRYKPNLSKLGGGTIIHQPYTSVDSITLVTDVGSNPRYKLNLLDVGPDLNVGVKVDKATTIPDNSHRYNPNEVIKKNIIDTPEQRKILSNQEKIEQDRIRVQKQYLYEKEKREKELYYKKHPEAKLADEKKRIEKDRIYNELGYNPNWRNEPATVYVPGFGDVMNVDALPPEEQLEKRKIAAGIEEQRKNPDKFILKGPGRYTDEYTRLYDPNGSKEERMAKDYTLRYGVNFGPEHYSYLREHLNRVKAKEIKEDDLVFSPYTTLKTIEPINFFVELD